jgi:DNA-binding response OmpR family regulator
MGLELGADDYLAKTFGRMGPDLLQDVQTVLLAEPQIEKDQARMSLFEVAVQIVPGTEAAGTFANNWRSSAAPSHRH